MKNLFLLLLLSISFNVFSQNNAHYTDWGNGAFNKRVLKSNYEKTKVDSLNNLLNSYIKDFNCYGSKCKYTNVDEDYYISIKMNNGYLKIKYYFADFDVLKIDELLPKIHDFLNG
jgi:hypothetical protein